MKDTDKASNAGCGEFELLMMKRLDGETSPEDSARLDRHLETCESCAKAFAQYDKIARATSQVAMREVDPEEWDIYWSRVSNRLERGITWILVCAGAAAIIAYAAMSLVTYVLKDSSMAWWAKAGIFVFFLGLAWLFASVAREKIAMRRTDRYREIKR